MNISLNLKPLFTSNKTRVHAFRSDIEVQKHYCFAHAIKAVLKGEEIEMEIEQVDPEYGFSGSCDEC